MSGSLYDKLQKLQEAVGALIEDLPQQANADPDASGGSVVNANRLKKMEDRFMVRMQASEGFLVQQIEENVLASAFVVTVFMVTALYIFYILVENSLRLRRCRCPADGWDVVVNAAKFILSKDQQPPLVPTLPPSSPPVNA